MRYFLVISVFLLLQSCYYDNEQDLYPVGSGGCDTLNLSYQTHILPIISSKCQSCHGSVSPNGSLSLMTHAQIKAAEVKVRDRINRSPGDPQLMPKTDKLPACQIRQLELWYNDGAPNN
ncbi:MAG: hypothetical protein FJ344_01815 [Sphingomonadales bacterium]|nr:hypothetical protein [Sphingomonadales bacterium]